jgi:hypothetical protein
LRAQYTSFNALTDSQLAKVFKEPTVRVSVTTTTNDTGSVLNLTSQLSSQGKPFLDNHFYRVVLRHVATTDNDRYYQMLSYVVLGRNTAGSDPIIIGDGDLSTGVQGRILEAFAINNGATQAYGRTSYNGTLDVEATDGTNSHGFAAAAFSSGASALTFPLNRTSRVIGLHCEQSTYSAAEGSYAVLEDHVAAGTGTIRVVQADDGTGATNPTAGSLITATMDVYPPVNAFLVMDGTPDPGDILVYVLGISSDEVLHTIDVFVDDGVYCPFYGS